MEQIVSLLALQVLYSFEQNGLCFIISNWENIESDHYDKHRLLLAKIHTSAIKQGIIPKNELKVFVKKLGIPFYNHRNVRNRFLLDKVNNPNELPYPYPKDTFLLQEEFIISKEEFYEEVQRRLKNSKQRDIDENSNFVVLKDIESSDPSENAQTFGFGFPDDIADDADNVAA